VIAASARRLRAFALALGFCAAACGTETRRQDASKPVRQCLDGINRALSTADPHASTAAFFDACADVFHEPACRDGFHLAAQKPLSEQLGVVAGACSKAYCPQLGSYWFEMCRPEFVPDPVSLTGAWPPLEEAILVRETDLDAVAILNGSFAVFIRAEVERRRAAAANGH